MESCIKIWSSAHHGRITPDVFDFPGGEVSVNIERVPADAERVSVRARLRSPRGIMELLLVTDALKRRCGNAHMRLFCFYVPYARQDRVCNKGEALSSKVMCDLINFMGYDEVVIADPHSDIIPALINNCRVIEQPAIFDECPSLRDWAKKSIFVSPDAGAEKKTLKIARHYEADVLQASKIRDVTTGEITAIRVPETGGESYDNFLIIDDICDGGGTFMGLAQAIKEAYPQAVISLYVTHGIFSQGLEVLQNAGISHIYTTNSICEECSEFLTTILLEGVQC